MNQFPDSKDIDAWMAYVDTLPPLGEHWIDSAKAAGNSLVVVDTTGASLTAPRALVASLLLSKRIAARSPEQNIGLLLPTTAGGMMASMAVMVLGKTLVTLNYTAPLKGVLSAVRQAELKTVYTSSRFLEKLKARGINLDALSDEVDLVMLEDLSATITTWEKLTTLLTCKFASATSIKNKYCAKPDTGDTAVILFSSGSEGEPKGVMLSHKNLLANIKQVSNILNANPDDAIMANLPIFHSFGMLACMLLPLLERIKVVCHTDPTDVVTIANAIKQHKITLMFGTSSFFRLYIRNRKITPEHLASIRLTIAGAEKLQSEVSAAFKKRFKKTIYEGYGCTELAPVANVNTPFPNLDSAHLKDNHKPGTVGKPVPGTLNRIGDPETLEELHLGTAGMVMVAGPQVMQGYLKNDVGTQRAVVELEGRRWYVTGDKGFLDEDGFLTIEDRYARFAKISGEMIGLGTVERVLQKILDNEDIEVMAVNIPDPKKGEIIVILTTSDLDGNALRPALLEGGLNNLSLPTAYITIEALPKLGSGKADYATAKEVAKQAMFSNATK